RRRAEGPHPPQGPREFDETWSKGATRMQTYRQPSLSPELLLSLVFCCVVACGCEHSIPMTPPEVRRQMERQQIEEAKRAAPPPAEAKSDLTQADLKGEWAPVTLEQDGEKTELRKQVASMLTVKDGTLIYEAGVPFVFAARGTAKF